MRRSREKPMDALQSKTLVEENLAVFEPAPRAFFAHGGFQGVSVWMRVAEVLLQPRRWRLSRLDVCSMHRVVGRSRPRAAGTGDDNHTACNPEGFLDREGPILRRQMLENIDARDHVPGTIAKR
jgi:hypothetical protein